MISKPLAQHLNNEEALELKDDLTDAGIGSLIKRQGLPRLLGGLSTYRVLIDPVNIAPAQKILQDFSRKCDLRRAEIKRQLSSSCPGCRSLEIAQMEKRSLWHKFVYAGVTVWTCQKCRGRWFT